MSRAAKRKRLEAMAAASTASMAANTGHEVLGPVPLNGGRDEGEMIRESGEDGGTVYHAINRTQRLADRMYHRKLIDATEHQAACALRDAYERIGFAMGYRTGGGVGGGARDDIADEEAFLHYRRLLRAAGDYRLAVVAVVIDDTWLRFLSVEQHIQALRAGLLMVAREAGLCS